MEYLDTYDENGKFLGKKTRDFVHTNALWHNTIHCWLYDKEGNIYFQIRKDTNTFYTTASGHVLAGETIKEAFGREISEEIEGEIDIEKCELVDVVIWSMDKEKDDGTMFRDRAFANVYVYQYDGSYESFNYQKEELAGIVKVNAKEALELFTKEEGEIPAEIIVNENGKNISIKRKVDFKEFLVNKHETAIEKYGDVLNKIIELTSKN